MDNVPMNDTSMQHSSAFLFMLASLSHLPPAPFSLHSDSIQSEAMSTQTAVHEKSQRFQSFQKEKRGMGFVADNSNYYVFNLHLLLHNMS